MWVALQKVHIFFSAKILAYMPIFNDQSFNDTLTNDIISFEQLGPGDVSRNCWISGIQCRPKSDATFMVSDQVYTV